MASDGDQGAYLSGHIELPLKNCDWQLTLPAIGYMRCWLLFVYLFCISLNQFNFFFL
jgi:hypothetical protein